MESNSNTCFNTRKFVILLDPILESPVKTPEQRKSFISPRKNPDPSPDFLKAYESSQDSVILIKKPSSLPHLRKNRNITFSKALMNASTDNTMLDNPRSKNIKEKKTMTLTNGSSQNDSCKSNSFRGFTPLMVSSPRCASFNQGRVTRRLLEKDMNTSSIPAEVEIGKTQEEIRNFNPPKSQIGNMLQNLPPFRGNAVEEVFQRINLNRNNDSSSARSISTVCKYHDNSNPSFVTRVFRRGHECQKKKHILDNDRDRESVKPSRPKKSFKHELPQRPKFPKYNEFCNKYFYRMLTQKLEPEYRIQTNAQVVKLAKYISMAVDNVVSHGFNYQKFVDNLKKLLFRKKLIRTHVDFFFFCIKYLPHNLVKKVVPTGINKIDFDWNMANDVIE